MLCVNLDMGPDLKENNQKTLQAGSIQGKNNEHVLVIKWSGFSVWAMEADHDMYWSMMLILFSRCRMHPTNTRLWTEMFTEKENMMKK